MSDIKVLALDLDGTLTNDQKLVTPRTRAALDAAIEKGVTIVLASGRPTAGIQPLAEELGLDKKGLQRRQDRGLPHRRNVGGKDAGPRPCARAVRFFCRAGYCHPDLQPRGHRLRARQGRVGQQGVLYHQAAHDPCGRFGILCELPRVQDAYHAGPRPPGRGVCRRAAAVCGPR